MPEVRCNKCKGLFWYMNKDRELCNNCYSKVSR